MTETNHFRWRHELFRGASLIAGFGVRAPGRNRKINHDFIRGVLGTADKLDQQMVKKNSPLDKGYVDKVFKQLAAVTGTQSVLDYCVQIIEGEPGSRSLSCEQQWTIFMAQAKMIQADYLDLRHLQKDPPQDDDGTELRSFYNTLQNTCPAREASQIPRNEVEKAERYRVSLRESLIRLIYWWNVQKNFRTYFALDLEELNTVLDRLGVKQKVPALDGTTGRIEYVQAYNKIYQALRGIESDIDHQRVQLSGASNYTARRRLDEEERLLDAARDRFKYLYPLYAMEGEDSVGEGKGPSTAVTLSRGGIPFHWIEPGAVLEPRRSK
jgi:hypothetical protein